MTAETQRHDTNTTTTKDLTMFSIRQKRQIADAVQKILRDTNHAELPAGEIKFHLHVKGGESWSWADIQNNGEVTNPGRNEWNEAQDPRTEHASKQDANPPFAAPLG